MDKQRIKKLFESFDYNKTGLIDHQCIKKRFSNSCDLPGGIDYARELLVVIDVSKDGFIDYQEFYNYVTKKEAKLKDLFAKIDVSKDSYLQPEELKKCFKESGIS